MSTDLYFSLILFSISARSYLGNSNTCRLRINRNKHMGYNGLLTLHFHNVIFVLFITVAYRSACVHLLLPPTQVPGNSVHQGLDRGEEITYSHRSNLFVLLSFLVHFKKNISFLFWQFFNFNFTHSMFKITILKNILVHSTYL